MSLLPHIDGRLLNRTVIVFVVIDNLYMSTQLQLPSYFKCDDHVFTMEQDKEHCGLQEKEETILYRQSRRNFGPVAITILY